MLLEQLVAYADKLERQGKSLPFMYQAAAVKWLIHLDSDGMFQRFEMTSNGLEGKKNAGKVFQIPHLSRQGAKAKLLCDDAPYVLGIAREKDDASKVPHKHQLFKQELLECWEETQLPEVKAILSFLEMLPSDPIMLPEGFTPSESITFVVGGVLPIENLSIKSYWASKFITDEDEPGSKDKPAYAECLISGQYGPVMRIEPLKIKGGAIPDGQTSGMNLVSTDKDAFSSYGLKAVSSAPIRLTLAVKYANALNTLLRDPITHLRVGPAVYAFWTKEGETPPIVGFLKTPSDVFAKLRAGQSIQADIPVSVDSEQVKKQISSVFTGNVFSHLKPDDFYAACFSASGSRVVLRDYLTSTVKSVGENLARYFATQNLIDTQPMGVFELTASLYRDVNKELTTSTVTALLENALKGKPLPYTYLVRLANRNRAEQRITKPRAVLTRMTLISMEVISMEELVALETEHSNVGYQLGRLMAVIENLQWLALVKYGSSSKINSTVTDRFYASFSSTPVLVFANIMAGAQDHLSRIRKSNGEAFAGEDKRLGRILGMVQNIPEVLTPVEQAFFSLGYYHEKVDRFARIQDAKDNRSLDSETESLGAQA